MMVSDPARVRRRGLRPQQGGTDAQIIQWVKDVAEAGGKSYTFHIEATGPGKLTF